jgi:histidine ammonia-lyase
VANAEMVVALEVLAAAQGLDLRAPLEPGPATAAARDAVRQVVPFLAQDRELKPDVDAAIELVECGDFLAAVEGAVGPLV